MGMFVALCVHGISFVSAASGDGSVSICLDSAANWAREGRQSAAIRPIRQFIHVGVYSTKLIRWPFNDGNFTLRSVLQGRGPLRKGIALRYLLRFSKAAQLATGTLPFRQWTVLTSTLTATVVL